MFRVMSCKVMESFGTRSYFNIRHLKGHCEALTKKVFSVCVFFSNVLRRMNRRDSCLIFFSNVFFFFLGEGMYPTEN